MRPKMFDIDPPAVDDNGIAETQTPVATGVQALTLNGALCDLGTAGALDIYDAGYSANIGGVRIGITSAGNDLGRTFTATGTNHDGQATTEAISGASGSIAEWTTYWREVSLITTDDDTAGAIIVGTVDEIATPTIPVNWRSDNPAAIFVDVTGTVNYTVDEFFGPFQGGETIVWSAITAFSAKTADVKSTATAGATAIRLKFNSYTTAAEIQMYTSQTSCW